MRGMAVRFQASLPVAIFQDGKHFIAYSPVLDLSISGKTFGQVRKRFTEAVQILIDELVHKGTLEEVLLSLGWQKKKRELVPPLMVAQQMEKVSIPLAN